MREAVGLLQIDSRLALNRRDSFGSQGELAQRVVVAGCDVSVVDEKCLETGERLQQVLLAHIPNLNDLRQLRLINSSTPKVWQTNLALVHRVELGTGVLQDDEDDASNVSR